MIESTVDAFSMISWEQIAVGLGLTIFVIVCVSSLFPFKSSWQLNEDDVKILPIQPGHHPAQRHVVLGELNNNKVAIKQAVEHVITREVSKSFTKMLKLDNQNVCKFYGACTRPGEVKIVREYCARGSLHDLLNGNKYDIDDVFRESLLSDLVCGMLYIHKSPLKVHGNLKSSNCLIDVRFVLKISGFGVMPPVHARKKSIVTMNDEYYEGLLSRAPEIVRSGSTVGTQPGDVYSFAIVMQEIYYRKGPFYTGSECTLGLKDKVKKVCQPIDQNNSQLFRPTLLDDDEVVIETSRKHLMRKCWDETPRNRPDFDRISRDIRIHAKRNDLIDDLIMKLEQYSHHLEEQVEDRTNQLTLEKERADGLLYQMLPRVVADRLKKRQVVDCESFDCVTIYFSDIVGFTSLCHDSTPYQVVELLNALYTMFDGIIDSYDVYKVETIGDAYMVASGLPIRNGDEHAREIANMSLELLDKVSNEFKISHMPDKKLELRIGIHSGPVVAGVVGWKMPRYCLFGDTVNTASRMESNGKPLRIHISPKTKKILEKFDDFDLQQRKDEVYLKGLGVWQTWWLAGRKGASKRFSSGSMGSSMNKRSSGGITGIIEIVNEKHVKPDFKNNNARQPGPQKRQTVPSSLRRTSDVHIIIESQQRMSDTALPSSTSKQVISENGMASSNVKKKSAKFSRVIKKVSFGQKSDSGIVFDNSSSLEECF